MFSLSTLSESEDPFSFLDKRENKHRKRDVGSWLLGTKKLQPSWLCCLQFENQTKLSKSECGLSHATCHGLVEEVYQGGESKLELA